MTSRSPWRRRYALLFALAVLGILVAMLSRVGPPSVARALDYGLIILGAVVVVGALVDRSAPRAMRVGGVLIGASLVLQWLQREGGPDLLKVIGLTAALAGAVVWAWHSARQRRVGSSKG
jgi:hypothetical protein